MATYLVRHAKAEPHGSKPDADRRLTQGGREAFRAFVAELRPPLQLRRIVTSPLARARETADLLALATGAPVEEDARLASGALSGRDVLRVALALGPGVALVGHNPELADAVALAAGADRKVPPGAVAALEPGEEHGSARLAWLASPAR